MAHNTSPKKDTSLEGTPAKKSVPKKSGHKGGAGTAHTGGSRSSSPGSGRAGSTSQRSTNR